MESHRTTDRNTEITSGGKSEILLMTSRLSAWAKALSISPSGVRRCCAGTDETRPKPRNSKRQVEYWIIFAPFVDDSGRMETAPNALSPFPALRSRITSRISGALPTISFRHFIHIASAACGSYAACAIPSRMDFKPDVFPNFARPTRAYSAASSFCPRCIRILAIAKAARGTVIPPNPSI